MDRRSNLHRSYLVFRTVGCPVRILGCDHVGAGLGSVERRIHDARLHTLGNRCFQRGVAFAAGE